MRRALSDRRAGDRGEAPLVVVTGGLSRGVGPYLPEEYARDENLLLRGLSIIYKINTNNC
jgi:pantothenate kinase type III